MSTETKQETNLPEINALWNFSEPQETEKKFRELIPKAEEQKDKTYYAELLTQLARTQSLQRNFDEAHDILDRAKTVITDEMIVPRIRYHLERGRAFNSANRKPEASDQFKLAYDLSLENSQDYYAVDAAHMLGISEKPEQQLEWNLKAMELAEKSDDPKANGWLGPLYTNIGWTYHDLGQYEKALELFNKSLDWRVERQDKKGTFIAKWTIGRSYRSLNRIEDALKMQKELLKEIEEGKSDPDGYVYEEIGECLLIRGETEEAKGYFKKAYELLSKDVWLQANEKERLERLKELGT